MLLVIQMYTASQSMLASSGEMGMVDAGIRSAIQSLDVTVICPCEARDPMGSDSPHNEHPELAQNGGEFYHK